MFRARATRFALATIAALTALAGVGVYTPARAATITLPAPADCYVITARIAPKPYLHLEPRYEHCTLGS